MKKRIGWLNNKPIIQGDKNLKNSNELHIDELSSSNSQGGGGNIIQPKFYKVNREYSIGNAGLVGLYANLFGIANVENDNGIRNYSIVPTGTLLMYGNTVLENLYTLSFIPVKSRTMGTNQQFGDYVFFNTIYDVGNALGATKEDIDKAFIEITEEEFYNFNPNNL